MTKGEAIAKADAALQALASVELAKARETLADLAFSEEQIVVALTDVRARLDAWRAETLASFETWLNKPIPVVTHTMH